MFERIANVDRRLLFLNLLLLMGIAFLPFPTALLASYLKEGGSNSHLAAAVLQRDDGDDRSLLPPDVASPFPQAGAHDRGHRP